MSLPVVTTEDVRSVYPDIPPDKDATTAIQTAMSLVQTNLIDNGCGSTYSDGQLKLIIMWLAAHVWQTQNGVISSISAGSASESYQMSTDFFLKGTLHGQQAMMLDTNHCLAQLMADTDLALQGRQSFAPSIVSLHSNKQRGIRKSNC